MSNPIFTGAGTHTGYATDTLAESVAHHFELKRQVDARNLREAEAARAEILANRSEPLPPPVVPEPARKPISEPDTAQWDNPTGFDFNTWRGIGG